MNYGLWVVLYCDGCGEEHSLTLRDVEPSTTTQELEQLLLNTALESDWLLVTTSDRELLVHELACVELAQRRRSKDLGVMDEPSSSGDYMSSDLTKKDYVRAKALDLAAETGSTGFTRRDFEEHLRTINPGMDFSSQITNVLYALRQEGDLEAVSGLTPVSNTLTFFGSGQSQQAADSNSTAERFEAVRALVPEFVKQQPEGFTRRELEEHVRQKLGENFANQSYPVMRRMRSENLLIAERRGDGPTLTYSLAESGPLAESGKTPSSWESSGMTKREFVRDRALTLAKLRASGFTARDLGEELEESDDPGLRKYVGKVLKDLVYAGELRTVGGLARHPKALTYFSPTAELPATKSSTGKERVERVHLLMLCLAASSGTSGFFSSDLAQFVKRETDGDERFENSVNKVPRQAVEGGVLKARQPSRSNTILYHAAVLESSADESLISEDVRSALLDLAVGSDDGFTRRELWSAVRDLQPLEDESLIDRQVDGALILDLRDEVIAEKAGRLYFLKGES